MSMPPLVTRLERSFLQSPDAARTVFDEDFHALPVPVPVDGRTLLLLTFCPAVPDGDGLRLYPPRLQVFIDPETGRWTVRPIDTQRLGNAPDGAIGTLDPAEQDPQIDRSALSRHYRHLLSELLERRLLQAHIDRQKAGAWAEPPDLALQLRMLWDELHEPILLPYYRLVAAPFLDWLGA